jgi:glycosyltransferase involved in cell wall biosynthesis
MAAEGFEAGERPRVLAVLPQFIPSTFLTVVKPLTALHRAGQVIADITLESWVSARQIERADVVLFSRNTNARYQRVLDTVQTCGKPIVYDIDDNFFELPAYYQDELPQRSPEQLAQLERYLVSASLVRVYSTAMRERALLFNPHVARVDGPIDWSLLPASPPRRQPGTVHIVYATSRWLKDDLAALFLDDLRRLLRVYRGRVTLFFWGYHPPELKGHPSVRCWNFVSDYDRFFRKFARAGFDIGLAPLRDEPFYRAKSNNKFREYAACRIAGVYSDVEVYAECVEDGRTGLLVSSKPEAWFTALSRLIEDALLREQIQDQAYRYARTHYSLEHTQAVWLHHIHQVLSRRTQSCALTGPGHALPQQHNTSGPGHVVVNIGERPGVPPTLFMSLGQRAKQALHRWKTQGVKSVVRGGRQTLQDLYELLRVRWRLSKVHRKMTGILNCRRGVSAKSRDASRSVS